MNARIILLALAIVGLASTGCDGDAGDDDDTAPEPEGCESMSLQNILYDFVIEDPDDLLGTGLTETDDVWWTAFAQQYADEGNYAILYLAFTLVVASVEQDGSATTLRLEYRDDEGTVYLTVVFSYFLPQGKAIPVAVEQVVDWYYVWNFVTEPRTAPMFYDTESGDLLFYGEPGAGGLTFNNDPYYPDQANNPTTNPLFAEVRAVDEGCSPLNYLECGNQFNLKLEFTTWDGQEFDVWPGETGTFLVGEAGAEREYELTNVWSYDWSDVSCDGPQYERSYAFFVLPASAG